MQKELDWWCWDCAMRQPTHLEGSASVCDRCCECKALAEEEKAAAARRQAAEEAEVLADVRALDARRHRHRFCAMCRCVLYEPRRLDGLGWACGGCAQLSGLGRAA